jgi:magnesium transporter
VCSSDLDFIAYRILDNIVDSYFPIMDELEDGIELIEKDILNDPTKKDIPLQISKLKRKFLAVRKVTWPAREVFSTLAKSDIPYFLPENRVYYRDIHDHMILIIDMLETYRDEVSSILESYLSALSNNLNSVMKVLTVIATIFMPITFIASLYGMNFQNGGALNMPETYWQFGYPFVLTLMLIVSLSMVVFFKRKGWL